MLSFYSRDALRQTLHSHFSNHTRIPFEFRGFHSSCVSQVAHRANHYTVLGVPHGAPPSEIKTAFYKCSMQWHPDRNQGSEEAHRRFLKISEAYSILGNEQKRRAYDRSLQIRTSGSVSGARPGSYKQHSTAFSSSGEYTSARRTERMYRRPESTYTRDAGRRERSKFGEWERQHYGEMKERADNIDQHVKKTATRGKYSTSQISMFQFGELIFVFTVVFGVSWSLSGFVRVDNTVDKSHKPRP
ncbi:hypothetical protein LPJ77_000379 [Coemansia sp. RSA 2523]|nr:hypothetical protein LPJ77_000379 [Coemansia sp. RSA 2523]KAJ2169734.1 hypothetical protein GGH15_000317 [Coemansia sp. RSA 562]KAJ2182770.1 hypothetical protein GGF45_000556 [Coemansia sp. RSA 551]KAJ2251223.1 hypothetical protein GGH97_000023 [Coemansia sp. RSA 475]KAJ2270197.1 hypothetical protein J3F81_003984 [Coemansia sp. RSA 371]